MATRHGSRWLLPVISCGEMVRAAPLVARWCAERAVASDVAGQWLGRVGHDATDWLMASPARAGCRADDPLEWMALDALSSGASVVDYQTWALSASLRRGALPSVEGPFGNLDWPEDIRVWIGQFAGSPHAWTPYRVGPHEVVLGAETACGRVYFKGLTADRGGEAALTQALAAMAPDAFARTVAVESRGDGSVWWLAAECAGRPVKNAQLVAPELARIQRMTVTARGSLPLRTLDVGMAAAWASELLGDDAGRATIRRACAAVADADVPETWIAMDLDPTNVLVDDRGAVRFIDVDDSFFGPAPLAMAAVAARCGDASACRAYEESWSPALGIEWTSVAIAATVVRAWLGWNRLTRNIERGEVYTALDVVAARIRDRFERAFYRR